MRRTPRFCWLWAVGVSALVAVLLSAQTKRKGTSYAFLVACSGYDRNELKQLPYTIKEMEEFRDVLLASGYEAANVKLLHDKQSNRLYVPEKAKILRQLDLLLKRIDPEDTLLVAFNGHGVQFKDNKSGYFCPIDASLEDRKTLLPTEGADGLFERLQKCKAKRKLLIVNACRNDPASDRAQAATKINLEDRDDDEVPEGVAALYSCKAGQKSYYYDPADSKSKGRERSLFFHHVIEAWKGSYGETDKLTVEDFFRVVRRKTAADADNLFDREQTPIVRREYKGDGEWFLRGQVQAASMALDLGGGVKMEFVRIPAGKFRMGSPKDEKERRDDEEQHEVEITRAFYLGKYEVTQEQYQQIMGKNPSYYSAGGKRKEKVKDVDTRRFPVDYVSWEEATAFCVKLSSRDGKRRYRLPTEAEWEYACRGGTATPFHFGSSLNGDKANCNGNYPYGTAEKGRYLGRPCRVGSYAANAFGLYDMHGNVDEWCQDWYGPYSGLSKQDPLRTEKEELSARVLRGGSWRSNARNCRAALRYWIAPGFRDLDFGFRVAFRQD